MTSQRCRAGIVLQAYHAGSGYRLNPHSPSDPLIFCCPDCNIRYIKRLVYGMSEAKIKEITGNHSENPTLDLPCRVVFAAGQRQVEVIGPMLEDEAAVVHEGAWD